MTNVNITTLDVKGKIVLIDLPFLAQTRKMHEQATKMFVKEGGACGVIFSDKRSKIYTMEKDEFLTMSVEDFKKGLEGELNQLSKP